MIIATGPRSHIPRDMTRLMFLFYIKSNGSVNTYVALLSPQKSLWKPNSSWLTVTISVSENKLLIGYIKLMMQFDTLQLPM